MEIDRGALDNSLPEVHASPKETPRTAVLKHYHNYTVICNLRVSARQPLLSLKQVRKHDDLQHRRHEEAGAAWVKGGAVRAAMQGTDTGHA